MTAKPVLMSVQQHYIFSDPLYQNFANTAECIEATCTPVYCWNVGHRLTNKYGLLLHNMTAGWQQKKDTEKERHYIGSTHYS
jgi:hypothetical protein